MKIDPNHWFIRHYLGIQYKHQLPNTVCELGKHIVGLTLLYLVGLAIISAVLYAVFAPIFFLYDLSAMTAYYGAEHRAHAIVFVHTLILVAAVLIAGSKYLVYRLDIWHDKKRYIYETEYREWTNKLHKKEITDEEFNTWYYSSKYYLGETKVDGAVKQFFKAIWLRIKDKTCVLIDWK